LIFTLGCALGLIIVIVAVVAVTIDHRQRTRGIVFGFPDPIDPPIAGLGVNVALEQYDDAQLPANLTQIKQSGFTWIRQVFPWLEIEPNEGEFDWSIWDRIVQQSNGLNIIAVLDTSASWASASNSYPPTSTLQFANFARLFALRYGDRIDYYQIWDEPNLGARWNGAVNPIEYAELLRQARDAIRQVDPTATIILAGLAPTVETGPANMADWLYLRRLYEAGAHDLFDVVAGKPYGFDLPPDDHRIDPNILNFQHVVLLREEMEAHGDAGKAVWATQFGWNTINSPWGQTSEANQIDYVQHAIEYARDSWPWLGVMTIENWEPDVPKDDPRSGFSIKGKIDLAKARAPSQGFYPAALQSRPGSPNYLPNPTATFSGTWRFGELGADWSATGDSATIPFQGTSLALRVRRAADRANFYVTIDGQPANALPRDDQGRAYLQLIPPDVRFTDIRTIPVATGLTSSDHVAEVVAERGWNQWSLIGWSVGREEDSSGLNTTYLILVIGGMLFASGSFYFGRKVSWGRLGEAVSSAFAHLSDGQQLAIAAITSLVVYATAWMTWGIDVAAAYRRAGDTANVIVTLATATIFYVSPWLILTVISGIALLILIDLRLDLGLALVALFAPFFMLPRQLFESAFSMSELILLMCVVSFVIRRIAEFRQTAEFGIRNSESSSAFRILHSIFRIPHSALDRSVLVFLLVAFISVLFADYKIFALREFRVIILEPVIYYALIRAAKLDRTAIWRIVDALVLAGLAVAVIGLVQYAFNLNLITAEEGTQRLRSVYGSPNNVGLFLGRVFPIGLAIALLGRGQRRRLYALALLPIIAAILFSQSRGAIFAGVPASILAIGILAGGRWLWAAIGTLIVGALGSIPLLNSPRVQALLSGGGDTAFFRVSLWKSTLDLIREHPLLGVGPDNFLYAYRDRYLRPEAWQESSLSHPHNFALDFAARLGLIGLGAFVWMQIAFWRAAYSVMREAKSLNIENWSLIIGLMASMIDFLAHGLVDASYFVVDLAYVYMLTLALAQKLRDDFNSP
jgi:O-antigen ligase